MIRIRTDQWISPDSIESVLIRDSTLQIVPNRIGGNEASPYLVEKEFLVNVCGSLSLPYSEVLSVMIKQGENDVKEA